MSVKEQRQRQLIELATLQAAVIIGQAQAVITDLQTMPVEDAAVKHLVRAALDNCRVGAMVARHGREIGPKDGAQIMGPLICDPAYGAYVFRPGKPGISPEIEAEFRACIDEAWAEITADLPPLNTPLEDATCSTVPADPTEST